MDTRNRFSMLNLVYVQLACLYDSQFNAFITTTEHTVLVSMSPIIRTGTICQSRFKLLNWMIMLRMGTTLMIAYTNIHMCTYVNESIVRNETVEMKFSIYPSHPNQRTNWMFSMNLKCNDEVKGTKPFFVVGGGWNDFSRPEFLFFCCFTIVIKPCLMELIVCSTCTWEAKIK